MTDTIRITTGEAIIKFLKQQYIVIDGKEQRFVDGIMNIFGHGNVLGLGEAMSKYQDDFKILQGKNEQGMTHVAISYSKQNLRQKIYAVTSSVGPGSANLVTAAGTALANHIPVLLLPGDTFATRQPDPVLQQIEQQQSIGITTNDALKPVSRYFDRITRPEQIMSALIRAFEVMTNPATAGPATIALSQDVQGESYDFPKEFFEKRLHYVDRVTPPIRAIDEAIDIIKNSKNPLVIVGGGAKYSEAQNEVKEFLKNTGIPMVETQAGKSTILSTESYNLGGLGVTGNSVANEYAKIADVIIGVGTRYSDFTTSSKTAFEFKSTKFINLNVNRVDAYKMDALQVIGDARESISILNKALASVRFEFSDKLKNLQQEWHAERLRLEKIDSESENYTPEIAEHFDAEHLNEYRQSLSTSLPQTNALIEINNLIDDDAIVVAAAGSLPGDLERLWQSTGFNTYNMEYGYSTMGYEIAGALGAKIAEQNKEVYALVGDGSFLMLHTELLTALQYNYKINILLFDNSGYGCINNLQMGNGSDSFCTELLDNEGNVMNIDYAKVAEGYGANTFKVKSAEDLKNALSAAKNSKQSTLIDIKVLPKTMTGDYSSFWHVGVSQDSDKNSVNKARESIDQHLLNAKRY
ncbi:3D-(3,5/4)-trihydroxycyclohexane-1,2-dione acylhydrolase (decyclizing) [Staphylococcus kloosii]|uniref:3D-(3,5/4)-trihydroxycyclohexane-1,2-dione acylhydrolase (decyclizing) n=1 Tax=Staphylococcus kloosii TaxID=29384 RepID=UPI000D1DF5D0|nr:3D-(3,5/4)-trihydroxycyclohexane-1,2-dione acylhydrolase (decyclizing) [Staphylococcus kloosii]PTJ75049.1 3D-(3,5/4)-trihydroxycyclohexane-1,2-dione acylhydrolase (decyclizing) [Staphylococcus kloosii]